uniref:ENTH domain-containing protein n=1 Tax=Denticeps clupeoides TaxID=299321 RepID=A0AAY4BMZ0_9TELE
MTTSSLRRSMKNIVNKYTDAEIKVREATSNDPWGPPSSLMSEIADLTFNVVAFTEVMGIIWKRLNDHGRNWRHVYKALTLLDYLVKTGSERVVLQCRENIHAIQTLRDFQYIDREGQDQGIHVREKSKQLVALIRDEEKVRQERANAHKTRERLGYGSLPPPYPGRRTSHPTMGGVLYGEEIGRSVESPASFNSSSSSPQLAPDLEQARPQTSGEEELQLQLALAMSREESEKVEAAIVKPRPPVPLDMDEEAQLQLALSLSKEEHQQEQRSRQGDESLLQKALEESKREMEARRGGSAMNDLVDIFGPAPPVPSSARPWDGASGGSHSLPAAGSKSDPWDSLEGSGMRGMGSSWMAPPASSSQPQSWDNRRPPDPWDAPQSAPRPSLPGQMWTSPARGAVDLFTGPADVKKPVGPLKTASHRAGSPTDGDSFDEAMDGGQLSVNGRSEEASDLFDMSRLGGSLAEPKSNTCTPEAFLGPAAASLVNLDSLIPPSSTLKNMNPFLSGLGAPAASNPFQNEQPRLPMNQMRPTSSSPVPHPGTLPYSASLPPPANQQPSSFTQPNPGPGNLPQPLLPLSTSGAFGPQPTDQHSQNPFL